jgi:hypothetical protein
MKGRPGWPALRRRSMRPNRRYASAAQLAKTRYFAPSLPYVRLANSYVVGPPRSGTLTVQVPSLVKPSTQPHVPVASVPMKLTTSSVGSPAALTTVPSTRHDAVAPEFADPCPRPPLAASVVVATSPKTSAAIRTASAVAPSIRRVRPGRVGRAAGWSRSQRWPSQYVIPNPFGDPADCPTLTGSPVALRPRLATGLPLSRPRWCAVWARYGQGDASAIANRYSEAMGALGPV